MACKLTETPTANLYQLLAAPVVALVQADAKAIQTTLEYIERVGFDGGPLASREGVSSVPSLRMTTFRHSVPGADGRPQPREVQLPTLALLPIPSLQIDSATVELAVRIVDAQFCTATPLQPGAAEADNFLAGQRMELRAQMASTDQSTQKTSCGCSQIKLNVKVSRSDLPSGLSKLLNLMDQSGSSRLSEEKRKNNYCGC